MNNEEPLIDLGFDATEGAAELPRYVHPPEGTVEVGTVTWKSMAPVSSPANSLPCDTDTLQ